MAETVRRFWTVEIIGMPLRAIYGTAKDADEYVAKQDRPGNRRPLHLSEQHLVAEYPSLECPCCGDDAKFGDADGMFWDGDASDCGCAGHVTVIPGEDAYFNLYDHQECPEAAICKREQSST